MTAAWPLRGDHELLVDDDDFDLALQFTWHVRSHGHTYYVFRKVREGARYRTQFIHTMLTGFALVDHRNGNGLDNRRANLRAATVSQNLANSISRGGSSQYKGVSYERTRRGRKPWAANITVDGRQRRLGRFLVERDAARAYDEAARELFGEFAAVNFPRAGERSALLPAAEPTR